MCLTDSNNNVAFEANKLRALDDCSEEQQPNSNNATDDITLLTQHEEITPHYVLGYN